MKKGSANRSSRLVYISVLNVLAAVAVVTMHANVGFWIGSSKPFWPTANVIESVCYFAVPVFFMLSGATLIDYPERYTTKDFFKKRFKKAVIPFLAWSIVGLLWAYRKVLWAMLMGDASQSLDWTFLSVANGIVNTRFRDIYWFFIPLFCIYMVIPLFAAVKKERRMKVFTYIIGIALVINCAIPFLLALLKHYYQIDFGWRFRIYVGFEYLLYALLGYVLHKQDIKLKVRLVIYAFAAAGLLLHIFGTYYETTSAPNGKVIELYKGYYNLPCVLYSTGIFVLVKQLGMKIKSPRAIKVFTYLQGYTFPIYLIHRYFLDVFEENLKLVHMERSSLPYVLSATVLALLLSFLTTAILRKIPLLRHIVP